MMFLRILLFFLLLCGIHFLFVLQFQTEINPRFILKTYLFLFLLHFFILGLKKLFRKKQFNSPYLALSLNLLKMLSALIFLLPLLKSKTTITTVYVSHFFIAYFILLAQDIVNNKRQLKTKN